MESKQITVKLNDFNKQSYEPGKSKLIVILWFIINVLIFQNPLVPFYKIKTFFLKLFGAKIGIGVIIKPSVNIKYPWRLRIGNHVWIGEKVWIDNLSKVVIGNNVCISQGAMLLCGNHNYKKHDFRLEIGNIVIEDGVWLGAKSVISPGVTAGTHAVLTVGSVATKNLEPYFIYQGNPAVKIRAREMN